MRAYNKYNNQLMKVLLLAIIKPYIESKERLSKYSITSVWTLKLQTML